MVIAIKLNGTKIIFIRKNYKKARFRKHAQRVVNMLIKEFPESHSITAFGCERTH